MFGFALCFVYGVYEWNKSNWLLFLISLLRKVHKKALNKIINWIDYLRSFQSNASVQFILIKFKSLKSLEVIDFIL